MHYFLFALLCLLGTFFCGLRAGYYLYEKRCCLGALWLGIGGASGFGAMVLVLIVWPANRQAPVIGRGVLDASLGFSNATVAPAAPEKGPVRIRFGDCQ